MGDVTLHWPARSAGLTTQLQALRKAFYHKYIQEEAALKEQHNRELKRLREEKEFEWRREKERGEREQDLSSGHSLESLRATGQENKQDWENIEEEVAKVGDLVCLSVCHFVCLASIKPTSEDSSIIFQLI